MHCVVIWCSFNCVCVVECFVVLCSAIVCCSSFDLAISCSHGFVLACHPAAHVFAFQVGVRQSLSHSIAIANPFDRDAVISSFSCTDNAVFVQTPVTIPLKSQVCFQVLVWFGVGFWLCSCLLVCNFSCGVLRCCLSCFLLLAHEVVCCVICFCCCCLR